MGMEKIEVNYSHEQTVCQVTLNDGKGNVLDRTMMAELLALLEELKENPEVKLITFEGHGKHFSFGASVEEHTKDRAPAMLGAFHQIFFNIIDLGIPLLAKISGQCLGGGFELALICNVLFADKTAKMGQPEIILGVFPPPASIILPLKIGNARAEELLITGRTIDAAEGTKLGLINEVLTDKIEMDKAVEQWIVKHIEPKSASSLKFAVKAARKTFNHLMINKLPELEKEYLESLMATEDANEGIQSFIEKRPPVWKNC
jgi:cyclohexa-1,5-dienecarbonyl-CoA hydratase